MVKMLQDFSSLTFRGEALYVIVKILKFSFMCCKGPSAMNNGWCVMDSFKKQTLKFQTLKYLSFKYARFSSKIELFVVFRLSHSKSANF